MRVRPPKLRPSRAIATTAVALVLLVAAACGSSSSKASTAKSGSTKSATTTTAKATTSSAAATAGVITIQGFAFHPGSATAKVGQTITVKNEDSTPHTVTADDKSFDTGPINPGSSATFTVTKAGTYPFHCAIHEYMKGTLTVG